MGVMLNLSWRRINAKGQDVVGWPNPVTVPGTVLWPYQRMTELIPEIQAAGFTAIVLPPSTEGAAGAWSGGYDKYDDYGIDNTAFGTGEMLRHLVAVAHAYGLQVYGDLVLHQYDGGANNVYPSKRFPKSPSCFSGAPGGVVADIVPDQTGNFAFGALAAYQHGCLNPGDPPGYMHDGAIAASQWLARTIGFDGFRIDDAKGTNAQVIYDITHAEHMSGLYVFYEYFDGNPDAISNYVNGYQKRRGAVLDFALKFNSESICNNTSRVWMGQCAHLGWCDTDPYTAVTFCESADTDTSPGEQTIWNKIEQYALMLTRPGYPQVYYRDWSTDPGCYGMKAQINNLVWIHEKLAQGDFVVRLDSDAQVFAAERTGWGGAPGCLFVVNNDEYQGYTRTLQTHFGAWQPLHEYTGHGAYNDGSTGGSGALTVTVPPNDNGRGYLVYAPEGPAGGFPRQVNRTTQVFFCAGDLKLGALSNADCVIGTVHCEAGTLLSLALAVPTASLLMGATIAIAVVGPDGQDVRLKGADLPDDRFAIDATAQALVAHTGAYTLELRCELLPALGVSAELAVTYTGALA